MWSCLMLEILFTLAITLFRRCLLRQTIMDKCVINKMHQFIRKRIKFRSKAHITISLQMRHILDRRLRPELLKVRFQLKDSILHHITIPLRLYNSIEIEFMNKRGPA